MSGTHRAHGRRAGTDRRKNHRRGRKGNDGPWVGLQFEVVMRLKPLSLRSLIVRHAAQLGFLMHRKKDALDHLVYPGLICSVSFGDKSHRVAALEPSNQ